MDVRVGAGGDHCRIGAWTERAGLEGTGAALLPKFHSWILMSATLWKARQSIPILQVRMQRLSRGRGFPEVTQRERAGIAAQACPTEGSYEVCSVSRSGRLA